MKLIVNGKKDNLAGNLTVSQLLIERNIKMPEMVSVELNGQILKRSESGMPIPVSSTEIIAFESAFSKEILM